jgi:hypothetical protein
MKGQYVVYERASTGEARFFLDIGEEVVTEIDEPKNWRKVRNPRNHPRERPYEYEFRPMLLVLMLMVYHRKEYSEVDAHHGVET